VVELLLGLLLLLLLDLLLLVLFHFLDHTLLDVVNDLSVANDLDAMPVPVILLIPGVETAIDILADDGNCLPYYIFDFLGVQARDLEVLHSILLCVLFEI